MTGRTSPQEAAPDAVERLDLSAHASSATLARRFIRQFAARHSLRGELVDQLVLVGCELVTNALAAQLLEGASPLPPGDECLVSSRTRQIG